MPATVRLSSTPKKFSKSNIVNAHTFVHSATLKIGETVYQPPFETKKEKTWQPEKKRKRRMKLNHNEKIRKIRNDMG